MSSSVLTVNDTSQNCCLLTVDIFPSGYIEFLMGLKGIGQSLLAQRGLVYCNFQHSKQWYSAGWYTV